MSYFSSNLPSLSSEIVSNISQYIKSNDIKGLCIGVSGGIDSTYLTILAAEACRLNNIKLVVASLPSTTNESDEIAISDKIINFFIGDKTIRCVCYEQSINNTVESFVSEIHDEDVALTPLQLGNIKARVRMTALYDLSSSNNCIVLGTTNKTEWELGFWTICGDVGDIEPLIGHYKSEIYNECKSLVKRLNHPELREALRESIAIRPTDGNGVGHDLEQIGARSYKVVDQVLRRVLDELIFNEDYADEVFNITEYKNVKERHIRTAFKRKSPQDRCRWESTRVGCSNKMICNTICYGEMTAGVMNRSTSVNSIVFKDISSDIYEGEVLLVKRGSIGSNEGKWCLPCGYIEDKDTILSGCLRELFEETGVRESDVDLMNETDNHKIVARPYGNVEIYMPFELKGEFDVNNLTNAYSDINEIEDIKFVKILDLNEYDIAFNHDQVIKDLILEIENDIK